ncbi:MAG: DotU family type VI secretion system protein [Pseudomonadota bacterium]|nr:DotU family type VI secretion system protein [Pseudomonadota bacterium]
MNQDDPFSLADSDRTLIMPTPGGRASSAVPPAAAPAAPRAEGAHEAPPQTNGLNPLVAAANPLLDLVPQLQATLQHPDPNGLRDFLAQGIKAFEARAQAAGVRQETIIAARYALCTLLDETAASTPWGGSGTWARHSLLVMFHNEAWGGEKFFQLLSRLAEDPATHRDLLALMYVCLSLGFKGRYQVLPNGQAALDTLRERLAQMLRQPQGERESALSPHWQGVSIRRKPLFTALPLWVALSVLGLVMLGTYLGLNNALNERSDPVYAQIQALRVQSAEPPALPTAPALASQPRLAGLLAPQISQGLVAVRDEENRSIVTLRGDGLFAPGSATIAADYIEPLQRVAQALDALPGQIRVIGHTDDQPIRSARFPSNWHLSQERARAVMALLKETARTPTRYSAEGRADAEPLGPNTTAAQRALNRRVEIVLITPPATGS